LVWGRKTLNIFVITAAIWENYWDSSMEYLLLTCYVLGLFLLFFLLGAAIGGAARSFKAYFFGMKDTEYYCCEAPSAREASLVEASAIGASALGTAVTTDIGSSQIEEPGPVTIHSDETNIDPAQEWQEQATKDTQDNIDLHSSVSRDEQTIIEHQDDDIAHPLDHDEISEQEDLHKQTIVRDNEAQISEAAADTKDVEAQPKIIQDEPPHNELSKADVVAAAGAALAAAAALTSNEEQQETPVKRSKSDKLVWDYTQTQDDYTDVTFQAQGPADDLTLIRGIDGVRQQQLNDLGISQFSQIAAFKSREIGFLQSKLALQTQISEYSWIEQAKILASGALTAFASEKQVSTSKTQKPQDHAQTTQTTIKSQETITRAPLDKRTPYEQRFIFAKSDKFYSLDHLDDMTKQEQDLLDAQGVAALHQVANWSAADIQWASALLGHGNQDRLFSWVDQAKKLIISGAIVSDDTSTDVQEDEAYEKRFSYQSKAIISDLGQLNDISQHEQDLLASKGVASLKQVASWTDADMQWASTLLGHDNQDRLFAWVDQAKKSGQVVKEQAVDSATSSKQTPQKERAPRDLNTPYERRFAFDKEGKERERQESALDEGSYEGRFAYKGSKTVISKKKASKTQRPKKEGTNAAPRKVRPPRDLNTPYERRFAFDKKSQGEKEESAFEASSYEARFAYKGSKTVTSKGEVSKNEAPKNEVPRDEALDEERPKTVDATPTPQKERASRDENTPYERRFAYEAGEAGQGEQTLLETEQGNQTEHGEQTKEPEAHSYSDSDDLKQIKHISTGLEKKLNLLGIYKLSQISNWSKEDIANISEQLELKGRIEEENWIEQAAQAMIDTDEKTKQQSAATASELTFLEDISQTEKEQLFNKGIGKLSQIANWSRADMTWAQSILGFDNQDRLTAWVDQAKTLIVSGLDLESQTTPIPGGPAQEEENDLKRIRGIDKETEIKLKEMGVATYAQIASFEQSDMDQVNETLGTTGRVERQYWVVQAKVLRDGAQTDFSKLYDGSSNNT